MYLFVYIRHCLRSICQVEKKRKQENQLIESQKGALHKFFPVSSNAEASQDQGQEHIAEVNTNEDATVEQNLDVEADDNDHTQAPGGDTLHPSDDIETVNIDEQIIQF